MADETIDVGVAYDEVEGGDFMPWPDGTYPLEIHDVEVASAAGSGNKLIRPQCKLLDPKLLPAPPDGKRWTDRPNYQITISEKSLWKLKELCEAINVKWSGKNFQTRSLIGKKFMGVCVRRTYNGRENIQVDKALPMKRG